MCFLTQCDLYSTTLRAQGVTSKLYLDFLETHSGSRTSFRDPLTARCCGRKSIPDRRTEPGAECTARQAEGKWTKRPVFQDVMVGMTRLHHGGWDEKNIMFFPEWMGRTVGTPNTSTATF